MNNNGKLLGYYNYTVILTYIGMTTGFIGIIYAFESEFLKAIVCLMIAGFCDMFDGAIASTNKKRTEQEKCFGIQIDSLSDLICFGVLPALIVYSISSRSNGVLFICSFYVLCGLIRLAYFNVDEQDRQKKTSSSRSIYLGLPVTLSALFIPLIYGLQTSFGNKNTLVYVATLLITGFMFVIPFPIKKPKFIGKICVIICGVLEVVLLSFACLEV